MPPLEQTGESGFIAGLRRCGCQPERRNGVVVFSVVPVEGCHAGKLIETGVSADELRNWPSVPPHWVHLPASVRFSRTNQSASSIPGWVKHSRNIGGWGNASEPAQAWVAHVRAVLGEAR